ncbi:MAG: peptidase S8 [Deltaproteobacteria bacterium]|nr:peptidase S8 [Deltaproteobacteria bacterium]
MLLLVLACTTDEAPLLVDTEPYLDGEVLVKLRGDEVDAMKLEDENELAEVDAIAGIEVRRMGFERDRRVRDVIAKLEHDHRVEFVEPNHLVRAAGTDPYRRYQWNLDAIGTDKAWATTTGGGVVVAVLDTGVRTGGPDGFANLLAGYDFYNNDNDPTDGNGHGTFVAGTIAQNTGNDVGVSGVAPGAKILPVKVLGDGGIGDMNAIANGLVWATDQGAKVANLSLGSAYPSATLESACRYAYDRGVTVVAATGNEYASSVGYPARYDTVIAVGATGQGGALAGYSNRGTGLDLVAPGGDQSKDVDGDGYADGILQETIENGRWTYTFWEGTSMATPHVAAAAALLYASGETSPQGVYRVLTDTARDLGSAGYDTSYGYGQLDLAAAVAGVDSAAPPPEEETTPSAEPDTTAPTISAVSGYTQDTKFTLQWTTDEPATSHVNFTGYGEYGNATLTTVHALSFTGTLGSRYYFTLVSKDAAGYRAETSEYYIQL